VRTLVVVPTYNEAENIRELLDRVRASTPDVNVLVVDDNSPDGTAKLAQTAADEIGGIEVLHRPEKRGLGEAYRAGFGYGIERGYEALVQMDADLSHDPAALPQLLGRLDAGADLVIGSRYVPGGTIPHWPAHRRALSRYGNRYASRVLGLHVHDVTSGYRAMRADVLRAIDYQSTRANGYGFQIEQAYRVSQLARRIDEVPITFTDRVRGTSKMSWRIIVEAMSLVTWWAIRDRVFRRARPRPADAPAGPA